MLEHVPSSERPFTELEKVQIRKAGKHITDDQGYCLFYGGRHVFHACEDLPDAFHCDCEHPYRLKISHSMGELAFKNLGDPTEFRKIVPVLAIRLESDIQIETHEGQMNGDKGDYLVMNKDGSWPWPVKKEIFERTYARAEK